MIVIAVLLDLSAHVVPLPSPWNSFGIGVAAFAVGAASGWWFRGDAEALHKSLFVGAAALFIFLVALEYDTKFFDHLSKFKAGEVELELAAPKTEVNPARTSIGRRRE